VDKFERCHHAPPGGAGAAAARPATVVDVAGRVRDMW